MAKGGRMGSGISDHAHRAHPSRWPPSATRPGAICDSTSHEALEAPEPSVRRKLQARGRSFLGRGEDIDGEGEGVEEVVEGEGDGEDEEPGTWLGRTGLRPEGERFLRVFEACDEPREPSACGLGGLWYGWSASSSGCRTPPGLSFSFFSSSPSSSSSTTIVGGAMPSNCEDLDT